jgi:hypothetical protein
MLFLYGMLLLVPFCLSYVASRADYARYVDALFAAGMLASIWAFTNAMALIWAFPDSKQFHPLVDLIGLSVAIAAYMTQKQRWKLVLAYLFLCQLFAHAWFHWPEAPLWIRAVLPLPVMSGHDYVGLLNVLWLMQLVCVGTPGGGHVVVRALHYLRGPRGLPHLVRH